MIAVEYSNSKTVNAKPLTDAERQAWNRDFKDGYRKYWQQLPLSYCCNAGERAGFYAAADEESEEYRRECEEGDYVRSLGH